MASDTIQSPPPEGASDETPTGRIKMGLDALADYVVAFDAMRDEFRRMAERYDDLVRAISESRTVRPAWADDVLQAVTTITPSRAMAAQLEALTARVDELESVCPQSCPSELQG